MPTTAEHNAQKGVSLDLRSKDIRKKYTGEEFISNSKPEVSIKSIKGTKPPLNIESGTATITLADFPDLAPLNLNSKVLTSGLKKMGHLSNLL